MSALYISFDLNIVLFNYHQYLISFFLIKIFGAFLFSYLTVKL